MDPNGFRTWGRRSQLYRIISYPANPTGVDTRRIITKKPWWIKWVFIRVFLQTLKNRRTEVDKQQTMHLMKIGKLGVNVSTITIVVFVIFTILLLIASAFSPDVRSNLYWLIPCLIMLVIIPIALNYMSRSEYDAVAPLYEAEAKMIRVKLINENMIGKPVRIEGVVERVAFQFLNRPQYVVADRSGSIPVKMFTSPAEDVKVNDVVEVIGQVIRRYIVVGDPVINCVSIRKLH